MSKNNNQISIPIIKQGKDLCRLIFQRADKGKYDLKLEFRGNPYQVNTYRLFALCPIAWNVENPQQVNMSYHHGAGEYPVLIHLKDESKEGKEKYRTLPATRIQAPNTNQLFPIPLLKMELPQKVIASAPIYKEKKYHHPIILENTNVIEIFMASDEFDMDKYCNNVYGNLMISQMVLSFEYFASCSIVSDYSKSNHFMPKSEPAMRFCNLGGVTGMQLFVVMYSVPEMNERWKDIHVTFIENELAEEILLCTKVSYPAAKPYSDSYDHIFLGGPTLEQLKPPSAPLRKIPVMCNTTVLRLLNSKELGQEEKERLELLAGNARVKLYHAMKKFNENLEIQKAEYLQKANIFLDAFAQLKDQVEKKENKSQRGKILYMNTVEGFMLSDSSVIAEDIHLLFARFCNLEQVGMYRMIIKSKKYRNKSAGRKKYNNGIPICNRGLITVDHTEFSHPWMILDDMLSIDLLRGNLNIFLTPSNREPEVSISRSRPYFMDDNWDGMRSRLEKRGFVCAGPQFKEYDQKQLRAIYEQEDGMLEKVYQALLLMMEQKKP